MAWTLCSKEEVAAMYPVLTGNLDDTWSEFVEGLIRQHMGQPYLGVETTVTDELHNGTGTAVIRVNHPPIASVTSLEIEGTALASSNYTVDNNVIYLLNDLLFPVGIKNVAVTYVSGVAAGSIPYEVRFCAATMVIAIMQFKSRVGSDSSIKWSDLDAKIGAQSTTAQKGLVSQLNLIMQGTLRRPVVMVK